MIAIVIKFSDSERGLYINWGTQLYKDYMRAIAKYLGNVAIFHTVILIDSQCLQHRY